VLAAALLALLVVGGAIAAALNSAAGGGDPAPPAAAPPTTSPTPAPTTQPATTEAAPSPTPSPTPEPTTAAPTTAAPAPDAGAPPADPIAFVQNYYELLPENRDAAWERLGAAARERSGGRGAFESFWSGVSNVFARDLQAVDANTVTATIVFLNPDGSIDSADFTSFRLGTEDGRQVITSFTIGG
jgi:hypothetical protein